MQVRKRVKIRIYIHSFTKKKKKNKVLWECDWIFGVEGCLFVVCRCFLKNWHFFVEIWQRIKSNGWNSSINIQRFLKQLSLNFFSSNRKSKNRRNCFRTGSERHHAAAAHYGILRTSNFEIVETYFSQNWRKRSNDSPRFGTTVPHP